MWLGWEGWAVPSELLWPQMKHQRFTPKLAPRTKGSPFRAVLQWAGWW